MQTDTVQKNPFKKINKIAFLILEAFPSLWQTACIYATHTTLNRDINLHLCCANSLISNFGNFHAFI